MGYCTNQQIMKSFITHKLATLVLVLLTSATVFAQLPDPGFKIDNHTAILITDPQIDFLSPKGVTWKVVGKSVQANNTVANIDRLFRLGAQYNLPIFVSPHYYYPTDHQWKFEGALEALMHKIGMFDRKGALTTQGFKNSGADWLPRYKKYINAKTTVVTNPHKVFGPETNDLALQLRKRGINKVIIAGMSANLCVESHMRELAEQGFEIAVVKDATAAAVLPGLDGYKAALVNFRMIASHVYTTQELVKALEQKKSK
jgi:nicotinamidase-related amidase